MVIDKNIKILVAEDEYLISADIIRGLKKLGYANLLQVADGEDAYEMTCAQQPDVVLMDIMMPKLDGIAAAQKIQDDCPTPIIILTAYETEAAVISSGAAGVSAFLTKPVRPDEIERAIIIALARHADLMEVRRLNQALEQTLEEVKRLQGILPICAGCKKIRNDQGAWEQIEVYISAHSETEFSHSLCPICMEKKYAGQVWFEKFKHNQEKEANSLSIKNDVVK